MLLAVLVFFLSFILVIGTHEAGHALLARVFQVKILRVALGFGKPLLTWTSARGVPWQWKLWPLGGFVELANTRIHQRDENPSACLDKKPVYVRVLIYLAGGCANIIFTFLVLTFVFMIGSPYRSAQINSVLPESIAAKAGFKDKDTLVSVNGKATPSLMKTGMFLLMSMGEKNIPIEVKRANGDYQTLHIDLSDKSLLKRSFLKDLGIELEKLTKPKVQYASSVLNAMQLSLQTIFNFLHYFALLSLNILTGIIPFSMLLGPLSMIELSAQSFLAGMATYLTFTAMFSLAAAYVNLLPFPGLDGGNILYCLVEKIRGKPMTVAMEILLHRTASIIFVVLLINLAVNDLERLAT